MKIGTSSASRYSPYKTMVTNRAKRQAVSNRLATMNYLGGAMFAAKATQTQGLNELAVKQYAARAQADLKARLQNLGGASTALSSLGSSINTSA
jgi:hypothetical protein